MRILVFHGYLLRGTGSNIYNAALARALAAQGHEVHLLSQDRGAGDLPFVDAVGDWEGGKLRVTARRTPIRCTAYRPEIGNVLPVYVADEYEGFDARPFPELSDEEVTAYVAANVRAVRDVAARARPEVALANHAVMGPAILARAIGGEVPYAVKIHGSALEYTVRRYPDRFAPYAREGLERAAGVLVGSRHTAEALFSVLGEERLRAKTRLGPPGVDTATFRPPSGAVPGSAGARRSEHVASGLRALADRLAGTTATWGGEPGAAEALRALDPGSDRIVAYVGKLIVSKGVDLLAAAWPLVTASVPDARLCIVGFGTYRRGLIQLLEALGRGDLTGARKVAARGRELEGGPPGELAYLRAFLDGLRATRREDYVRAGPHAIARVHLTGRLEHADLPDLLRACEAQVVPSTFPEAFGMVAAEAAACGVFPISAAHSGLAEVTAMLAPAVDEPLRPLLAFRLGPGAVEELAGRLIAWLRLPAAARTAAATSLADLAARRYGWEAVAGGIIAAAEGRLSELPEPPRPERAVRLAEAI